MDSMDMNPDENTRTLFSRFISYYRPHRALLFLDITTSVLRAVFTVVIPYMVVRLLGRDQIASASAFEIWSNLGLMSILILLMAVCEYISVKWGHILGTRIETAMRADLFRHLQKLSFRYFDNTKTGHIMSRISNDLFAISELAHHGPEDFLVSGFMVCGSLAFMYVMNWQLAVVVTLPLPLLILWGSIFRLRLRRTFREVRRKVADINSNVENAIQGIREVKSYVKEDYAVDRFDGVNEDFMVSKSNMYGSMAAFHAGMMFLLEIYSVIIIGAGILLVHAGRLNIVEMLGFMMYRRYMFQPVRKLVGFVEQYQQGVAAFERFTEIMDEVPDIEDRPGAVAVDSVKGDVRIADVCFRYAQGTAEWVLENINISIPAGSTIALVGESGAGKSTIASLIPRFYEPQSGSIAIDGTDIMLMRKADLRRLVGIVQQNVFLFDTTIRENILFARPEAAQEEIEEAARRAHILDYIQSLPDGFDSLVGERGVKLSGGQKQRVSIARVFLKNPPILVFDEATSSLDSESEVMIQNSMEELCAGRTTLVIAHRLSTVRRADYTYVLKKGRVVEHGRHDDLLALGGYYKDLYSRSSL